MVDATPESAAVDGLWYGAASPNGVLCETCGHECIDRCPVCGAPQCCPACCSEGVARGE